MVAKRILIGGLVLLIGAAMLGGCSGTATSPSTDVGSCVTTNDRAVGCNQVGGYSGNEVTSGLVGATISGGGDQSLRNRIVGDFGTVGGGLDNTAGDRAAVGGGAGNTANGFRSVVGGGSQNVASSDHTTVAGGVNNIASYTHATIGGGSDNTANNLGTTVAGGTGNTASFMLATVGGGGYNTASSINSTVGGGYSNVASGSFSTVAGGSSNSASEFNTAVAGGSGNDASADSAFVGGGLANHATDKYDVVGGGDANVAGNGNDDLRDAEYSTVSGGSRNKAGGLASTVAGGVLNAATGAYAAVAGGTSNNAAGDFSFAAGRRANVQADHPGAILFADSSDAPFDSTAANEFAARATGGVRFVTAIDSSGKPTAGVRLAAGSGSWETLSDRNAKTNFAPVDTYEILARLASLPISLWNYKTQDASIRHIGPMAQDFYQAFGVGTDDKYISTVDINGVALAATQGLYQLVEEQGNRITTQQQHIAALEDKVAAQQDQISALEARVSALEQSTRGNTNLPAQATSTNLQLVWIFVTALCVVGLVKVWPAIKRGNL